MENRVQIRRGDGPPGFGDLYEYELGYDRISKALYIRNEDGIEIVNSNVIQEIIADSHENGKNYVRAFIGDNWTINENATIEDYNTLVHRGETGVTLDDKSYLTIRFDIGDTYVLSGYVKGTPNLVIELRSLDGSEPRIWTYNVVGDNYEYITEVFEIPAPGDYQLTLGGNGTETEGLFFKKLQIERGEIPSPWRPAPEDAADLAIDALIRLNAVEIKTTPEAITTTVRSSPLYAGDLDKKANSDEIVSIINQTAETIKIQANKIDLVGAVTVLSDIAGNLGTITAGALEGEKVRFDLTNGTILIGNSTEDYALFFDGQSLKLNLGGKPLDERLDEIEESIEDIELTPGPPGADGRGIVSTVVEYQVGTSGTTEPTGSWSSTVPSVDEGKYLWTRTTIKYTSGSDTITYSVAKQGEKGSQGQPGEKGADGVPTYLHVAYATDATGGGFSTTDPTGKSYLGTYTDTNKTDSENWQDYEWVLFKGADGATGQEGPAGVGISSSTVTYAKSSSGTTSPTNGWSSTVPSANAGEFIWTRTDIEFSDGATQTIYSVGKIGDKGDKGDKGDQGPQGIQGPPGNDGQSQYVHIRYSANSNGSGMTTNPSSATKYVGIAVTNSETAPPYTGFTWSKYVGEDGAQGPQGIQGPKGDDGQPTYTWIRYADTPTSGMSNFPDGKKYIGMAFNKTTETESNNYSDYQWSLMPQNIEIGGRNLLRNSGNFSNTEGWSNNPAIVVKDGVSVLEVPGGSINNSGANIKLDPKTTYTYSGIIAFDKDINGQDITSMSPLHCQTRYDGNNSAGRKSIKLLSSHEGLIPAGTWISIVIELETRDDDELGDIIFSPYVYGPAFTDVTYWIKNIKLEKGNTATDWTPAPEDVDEAIDAVDTKYSNKVAEINTTIDGITQRVEATETNITTINGKVTAHDTRIESAESKITPSAIVDTVRSSTAYTNDLSGKVDTTQFESYRLQTAQLIEDRVEKDGVIAAISLSPETAKIQANKIELEGLVTANSNFKVLTDGSIEAKNATISGIVTAISGSIGDWSIQNSIYSKHGDTYTTIKGSGQVAFAAGSPDPDVTTGSNLQIFHDGRIIKNSDGTRRILIDNDRIRFYDPAGAFGGQIIADTSHDTWSTIFTIQPSPTGYLNLHTGNLQSGYAAIQVIPASGDSNIWYDNRVRLNTMGSGGYAHVELEDGWVDINAAAGLWVSGTIYLDDGLGDPPTIRALTSSGRQGLLIRADGAGSAAGINLYGPNESNYPGAMILRSGGQATLYLYPEGNARFYGDLRVDGTIRSSTIIELTQNTRVTGWLQPKANNTYSLGGGSSRWSRIFLQYNPDVASDIRLKSSIQNIPDGLLGELKEIKPKMYQQGEKWHFGYVAQDVERALYKYALKEVGWDKAKDYVREFDVLCKDESYLSLIYAEIAVLKEAEMQARIDELESKVEQLLQ